MEKRGIKVVTTAVGDRYVLEEMRAKGYNLGGEQSGHVILSDFATTGDGQLTAVALMNYFAKEKDKQSHNHGKNLPDNCSYRRTFYTHRKMKY